MEKDTLHDLLTRDALSKERADAERQEEHELAMSTAFTFGGFFGMKYSFKQRISEE